MNSEQEIKNLISITENIDTKKHLERLLSSIERGKQTIICECGSKYKYSGKSKHLSSKKHIETIKYGKPYKALTSDFSKRNEELDTETIIRKKLYHKERYLRIKMATKDIYEKTI